MKGHQADTETGVPQRECAMRPPPPPVRCRARLRGGRRPQHPPRPVTGDRGTEGRERRAGALCRGRARARPRGFHSPALRSSPPGSAFESGRVFAVTRPSRRRQRSELPLRLAVGFLRSFILCTSGQSIPRVTLQRKCPRGERLARALFLTRLPERVGCDHFHAHRFSRERVASDSPAGCHGAPRRWIRESPLSYQRLRLHRPHGHQI